jgi:hypothetical protein
MPDIRPVFRAPILSLTLLALAGCSGDRIGFDLPGSSAAPQAPAPQPGAPAVSLSGRWLLSSAIRGQCHMTFASAGPGAAEGTIRPEGGCPDKFFTSRKWTYDQAGLTIRDHNGQPLAQLSGDGAQFAGKAVTSGELIRLAR